MKRPWRSYLTPNSWVGLKPTLFPRSECCHGPGSKSPDTKSGFQEEALGRQLFTMM